MAEASATGLSQIAARSEGLGPAGFVESYVSREHRDGRGDGCTIAALSGDAARQPAEVKTEFAAGIESLITALQATNGRPGDADQGAPRTMVIDMLGPLDVHGIEARLLAEIDSTSKSRSSSGPTISKPEREKNGAKGAPPGVTVPPEGVGMIPPPTIPPL